MTLIQRAATALLTLAFAAAIGAGAWWLITSRSPTTAVTKPDPAAKVGKVVKEDELNEITLTPEAEKRIGLAVAPVARKAVQRVRVYGGEVTIPPGRTILVAAPLTGVLKDPPGGSVKAGQTVRSGQPVYQLTPLLTPDGKATLSASLADVEGQVNNAKTQVDVARIALDRARRVFRDGAGSQRQVDEAQAAFDLANKTHDAAIARKGILTKVIGDAQTGSAAPVPIDAPTSGTVRSVSALAGQTVPSGAPIFEIIDTSTVWVRVPLPVGDLDAIDRSQSAQVGKLSAAPGSRPTSAKPVVAPPSANPISATVDVFYEMANVDARWFPGQRLGVSVPLSGAKEGLAVAWSALVFDVNGGTWVYEEIGPRRYARRRVTVSYTLGTDAVLASGPSAGTKVVSAGAQELFGAETGFVK